MHTPIQPPAPVNPVITIQPISVNAVNPEADNNPNPLTKLPVGTVVEGFVVNRDAQNNPILRTSIGDLRVSSEFFLKTGSEVVFKVDTSQASLARILTVDGLTPENYNAQNTRGLTKDTIMATALQPSLMALTQSADAEPAPPPAPPNLQALVLRVATQATLPLNQAQAASIPLLAQLTQLSAGTPLRLTLHDLKLPPLPVSISSIPDTPTLNQLLPQHPAAARSATQTTAASSITQPITSTQPQPSSTQPTAQASAQLPIQNASSPTAAPVAIPERPGTPVLALQQLAPEAAPFYAAIQRQQMHTIARQAATNPESLLLQSELLNPNKPASTNAQQALPLQATTTTYIAPPASATKPTTPATAAPTSSTLTPAANQFVADVIGHDADGANILHTDVATLKLYTTQPLPTGTSLLVSAEIDTQTPLQSSVPTLTEQKLIKAVTQDYSALEEIMTWLTNHQPEIAQQLHQRLPTLDHKLTSTLLFFISALKTGNVNEIFGKRAIRQLEMNAPILLTRLREDISQISANLTDSPLNNWTMIPLPMLHGQELHQARLYVSREPKEQAKSSKDHGQRFVLEVGLSQLGPMQFDGFIRNHEQGKNFDLIVRTEQPISPDISQGIRDIFSNSLQVTGLFGQLIFQQGPQHFFKPQLEAIRKSDNDSHNTILA